MSSEGYVIPTLTSERQRYIRNLSATCSDPSIFDDIDFNIAYNNRLKWIDQTRICHSEKDEKQKLNWFYNRIDAEVHFFNLFMGFMRNKSDKFYKTNFPHAQKTEEWKELYKILYFLEPFLPVNKDLVSFISYATPGLILHGYKGSYPENKETVINEYEMYFQNLVLPALIHLWKEALEIHEFQPNPISQELINSMISLNIINSKGNVSKKLDDVIDFLLDKVEPITPSLILNSFKQRSGKNYSEKTVEEVIRRVRND